MSTVVRRPSLCLLLALCLAACGRPGGPRFHAQGLPERLGEWQVLRIEGQVLRPNAGVVAYDLNTPLFSDYAHKLRTVWMPEGTAARVAGDGAIEFPVGTILSKTFYYPLPDSGRGDGHTVLRAAATRQGPGDHLPLAGVRLVETRLLVRRAEGWLALPYVWNEAQTDALLKRTGLLLGLDLRDVDGTVEAVTYQVPDQNQCGSCHIIDNKTRALAPIGPKLRHLNRDFDYADGRENQLARLQRLGYLQGLPAQASWPRAAVASDPGTALQARARAYLDINCGHCHSATGPANTSGLHLDAAAGEGLQLGLCKQPVAAAKGTGGRLYDVKPGDAAGSVLLYRMESDDPAVMMPELGRSVVHREGVQLLKAWIDAMPGSCDG